MDKKEILSKFSADPERYYKVKLFDDEKFERKSCATCKRFYWTIDENRVNCPDHSDDTYSLSEIHQQQKDLIIHKHGRKLNHFL